MSDKPKKSWSYGRLTTDTPDDNVSMALNLFFAKDKETWVRNGGPWPGCEDIKLTDFIRLAAKTMDLFSMELPEDDRDLDALVTDMLDEGPEELEGLLAIIHTAGWAFAELRERLKAYEDTGLTPEEIIAAKASLDQEDHCPVCGAKVEYGGDQEIVDNGALVSFSCPRCGAHGKAGYDLVFDAYYQVEKGEG